MRAFSIITFCLVSAFAALSFARAEEPRAEPNPEDLEFFEMRIRPVLVEHCFECHSTKAKKVQGGLKLDTRGGLLAGGDTGAAVVPAEPEKSLLIEAIKYDSERLQMPPDGKLPAQAIADLTEWVRRGAPFPPGEASGEARRGIDLVEGRKHWAFQPVRRIEPPILPPGQLAAWPQQRIDLFLAAAHAKHGLHASPPASRATLIRRITFDLLGLPPSPEEIQEFVSDSSPEAYAKLVDRLLASPHYGERWGRYWLDLARYCDVPESWREGQAQAWLYRDWVTRSLNDDMPYDEFVRRQLAVDLLPGFEPRDSAALGFLGLSPTYWKELKLDHNVIKQVVAEEWEERIDALAGTFLGLTVACARCHDHKFDPISTRDYYALAGVMASVRQDDRPIIAADLAAAAQNGRNKVKELQAQIDKLQAQKPPPEDAPAKVEELRGQMAQIKKETPHYDTPLAYAVVEASLIVLPDGPSRTKLEYREGQPQDVPVQVRGNAASSGPSVPRRFLSVLARDGEATFREGSGRRELAAAIVGDAAPLAARVIVNRIWKHHFGRGLVSTPSNFGVQGEKPTHPELLDDLAARFIEQGWSFKWLHREIVFSAAYQQASAKDAPQFAIDPDNVYLWRMPVTRLDVEAWRDAMLSATGELAPQLGGPPAELADAKNRLRTLYGSVKRRELADILRLNDFPDPVGHSGSRTPTTSPLQQLFVLNSPFMQARAAALARRLASDAGEDSAARLRRAHWLLFGRDASPDEIAWGLEFIAAAPAEGIAAEVAWKELCQALLAGNEVMFVD